MAEGDKFPQNPALTNANGAIPVIFSKKLALAFGIKGQGVIDNLTNENYAGEIKEMGDRVRIVIPEVPSDDNIAFGSANAEVCPTFHSISPEALDLIIDKKATFGLAIDDVQKAQTQFKSWLEGQANAYGERIAYRKDKEIAEYLLTTTDGTTSSTNPDYSGTHDVAGEYGTLTTPYTTETVNSQNIFTFLLQVKEDLIMSGAIGADGTYSFKPMDEEARDDRAVIVVTPQMHTLILSSYRVGGRSVDMADVVVKDGAVARVAGMDIVIDKALYAIALEQAKEEDPAATKPTTMPFLAGTKNAVTRASQISKVESTRDPYCFRDLIKGLDLYGFKLVHPECLVRGVLPVVAPNEALPIVNVGE